MLHVPSPYLVPPARAVPPFRFLIPPPPATAVIPPVVASVVAAPGKWQKGCTVMRR